MSSLGAILRNPDLTNEISTYVSLFQAVAVAKAHGTTLSALINAEYQSVIALLSIKVGLMRYAPESDCGGSQLRRDQSLL